MIINKDNDLRLSWDKTGYHELTDQGEIISTLTKEEVDKLIEEHRKQV